jgi:hypothetical protein
LYFPRTGANLQFASDRLKADADLIIQSVKRTEGVSALPHIDPALRADGAFWLRLLSITGPPNNTWPVDPKDVVPFVAPSLLAQRAFVEAMLQVDGEGHPKCGGLIALAAAPLRDDADLALVALRHSSSDSPAFPHLSERLKVKHGCLHYIYVFSVFLLVFSFSFRLSIYSLYILLSVSK